MKLARYLCLIAFWLVVAPSALADDSAPVDTTPPPAATEPTAPPAVDVAPNATAVPPALDSAPTVAREHHRQIVSAPETSPTPAPVPSGVQARYETGPSSAAAENAAPVWHATNNPVNRRSGQPGAATGVTLPPDSSAGPSPDSSVITNPYSTVSAQAPAQLTCHGKPRHNALPFLVAPYRGWTSVASFLDHDSPDYTVDGRIVIANGLEATSSDGQESDMFPAYWAPALRQFINYDGHNGYDFELSYQPVLAAAGGTVTYAGWNGSSEYAGYGQMVLINHHNGYVTLYGHLSRLDVHEGDKVAAGDQIGISGSTGHSSGPHLHFSVFHNCTVTDPYGWTGHGDDPLYEFDHERSSYLWLPGHDPLVLNPPPHWPAYPLGLRFALPGHGPLGSGGARYSRFGLPPADRLLLLNLPRAAASDNSTPAVALARTESAITQEAESLAPSLDDLQSQGLIERYAIIPAAAAVWVRGTASASQLESLAGVASLAGVRPHDLLAAQRSLSHDVLAQMGSQHAPSLWPIGFRSALHSWRPMTTVVNRHALVAGMALPGVEVRMALSRRGEVRAVAQTRGDPQTGGFVAMLHDVAGNPVMTRPGDEVQVTSRGKTASVLVAALSLKARGDVIFGQAQPGTTVPVVLTHGGGDAAGQAVVKTSRSGTFEIPAGEISTGGNLPAGAQAVGSVVNAAGDQEAATAFVPGMEITENSPVVRGWTVGRAPQLTLVRGRRTLLREKIQRAPDGTFQVELRVRGQVVVTRPGDLIRIGSRWHQRSITLPRIHVDLRAGERRTQVLGPPRSHVALSFLRSGGSSRGSTVRLSGSGEAAYTLPDGPVALGDTATVRYVSANGDIVVASGQARGILLREDAATLRGTIHPGTVLSIHAVSPSGAPLAGAVVMGDSTTGSFAATLRNSVGIAVKLRAGMHLILRDGMMTSLVVVPVLRLRRDAHAILLTARGIAGRSISVTSFGSSGASKIIRFSGNNPGSFAETLRRPDLPPNLERVVASVALPGGVTVEKALALTKGRTRHRAACSSSRVPPHRACTTSRKTGR